MNLYFDLKHLDQWHRIEWEAGLAEAGSGQSNYRLVDSPQAAECTIAPGSPQLAGPLRMLFQKIRPGEYTWDTMDAPAGQAPGFYCSLAKPLFDVRRHRSFCYPFTYNELIDRFGLDEATFLYSFVGAISAPVRSRMVRCLSEHPLRGRGIVTVQEGPWNAMFDRSGLPVKRTYADSIRRARFVLCPRGNGVGSVRLFEVMKAGRVPVIISDGYVLPQNVEWDSVSVRIRERDVARIPEILSSREAEWETMAARARAEWERRFSPAGRLNEIAFHLEQLQHAPKPGAAYAVGVTRAVAVQRLKKLYIRL